MLFRKDSERAWLFIYACQNNLYKQVIDHRVLITVTEYVIHFIITFNVSALLKYRVLVLLN